jgi:hypothetical protein
MPEAKRSKASKGRAKKSLADMFPVTKNDRPVEPLKLTSRPGVRRIFFAGVSGAGRK